MGKPQKEKKKNTRPKPKAAQQPALVADPQRESMFFQKLPQELREKDIFTSHHIYEARLR